MNLEEKYERKHQNNLVAIERLIIQLYKTYANEFAKLGSKLNKPGEDTIFTFKDYPVTKKKVNELLHKMVKELNLGIVNGVESEWTLANNKNNELCNFVFGDMKGKLTEEQYSRYYGTNEAAREAFKVRKIEGITLSERVWNLADQFKGEMELAIDMGLRDGLPAEELASSLKQYLKHPNTLFRRVRDERGQLVLSKAAKAYHPGKGVYRSSYMNARRLAVTEGNIAFHTADYLRTQKEDFVVGIKIVLSNNHTCLGADRKPHPFYDICDELQGKYPKDFKFTGWHPHCRCSAIKILKTEKEIDEENKKYLSGETDQFSEESVNKVEHCPRAFDNWLQDNKERAKRSYSMPYFIKDNEKYLPKGYKELYGMRTPYKTFAEHEAAMIFNKKNAHFSEAIKKNNRELNEVLPVMQGKIMNFTEADRGKANPNFSLPNAEELGYHHNCQTCTFVYELRRRGFNVEATPNPIVPGFTRYRDFSAFCAREGINWKDRFLLKDGTPAKYTMSSNVAAGSFDIKKEFIESQSKEAGRYEVYTVWEFTNEAHVFIVERQKDGTLLWFDPQSGRRAKCFNNYVEKMIPTRIGVLRIDDKIINPKFAERVLKSTD